jgi:O-succinylbenzoic acid--CoA ligase
VSGATPHLTALRAWVTERLGAPAAPRELRLIEEIPTLHTGKPDRRTVAARLGAA